MKTRILDEDVVRVYGTRYNPWKFKEEPNKLVTVLYWGDPVKFIDLDENDDPALRDVNVRYYDYARGENRDGVIRKRKASGAYQPLNLRPDRLLEVTFVDVQQGDATFVRTPDGKFLVVDGGEGPFVARLLASQYPGTTAAKPLVIDALIVTHGDADHFVGLVNLAKAATDTRARKRIHSQVARYFHNGLVKGPSKLADTKIFGTSRKVGGVWYATELYEDPRIATGPNEPFTNWFPALTDLTKNVPTLTGIDTAPGETLPIIRRVEAGDDDAFDVFRPSVDVQVLGPITRQVDGNTALPYFRDPHGSLSASHTINGHSVVMRLTHGNVSFLLGGDLNIDAEHRLREAVEADPSRTLRSEVLKVPHHGSHEFEQAFLDAVNPAVSVVSSGDEYVRKEYVHPRANLMAALGRASRGPQPLLFSTELAAFFAYRGGIRPEGHKDDSGTPVAASNRKPFFFGHERLVFGAVRVRTDGERVMCAVESAHSRIKESYAFTVDPAGNVLPEPTSLI